jgi:ribosomal protein S18 acetylase RimI-like enzyme
MDLERARATERHVLSAVCSFTPHGDYGVYRSERFPRFYGGNGLDFTRLGDRTLADLERLFELHFDPRQHEHRTFYLPDTPECRAVAAEAALRGYHVARAMYLFADRLESRPVIPAGLALRRVDDLQRWKLLESFFHELSAGEDWYGDAEESSHLFEKTRVTAEAIGVDWYYMGPADGDAIWSRLGVFSHGGVCRLQDVGTLPSRRRGRLATTLLQHAIEISLQRGAGLVVCADEDYYAIDLYRKLGFRDVGRSIDLMWYGTNVTTPVPG